IVQFEIPPVLDTIIEGGAAERAGLRTGDRIVSTNGQPVTGWVQWVNIVRTSPELTLNVVVERASTLQREVVELTPAATVAADGSRSGVIGASVAPFDLSGSLPASMRREISYNPLTAIGPALAETWDKSVFVLDSIKKMVIGLISVKNINGPITIAQVAGETASYGLEVYLGFLAILSISLGVMNLLPIPVLDGGHLLYY